MKLSDTWNEPPQGTPPPAPLSHLFNSTTVWFNKMINSLGKFMSTHTKEQCVGQTDLTDAKKKDHKKTQVYRYFN